MRPLRLLVASATLALPAAAGAQGTLSARGLGYPPGQLSTMARGTAGGLAEFDALTPLNPATIAGIASTSLTLHYAPETRETTVLGVSDEATVVRFPVAGAVLAIGDRSALSLTASTFLDRTWATQRTFGNEADAPGIVETFESRGGITDVRLAGARRFGTRFQAGIGAHYYTGVNRLTASRADLSGTDANFAQSSEIGFGGAAASAGVLFSPVRQISLAASGRVGGTLRASRGDSTIASGTAPARAAASVRYTGLTGAAIGARVAWEGWSDLSGLGSEALAAEDALEYGVGADVAGPRIYGAALALRVGVRRRELPFGVPYALPADGVAYDQPVETSVSGGIGTVLGGNRVLVDLVVERARRTAASVTETGWVYGVGVTVRP